MTAIAPKKPERSAEATLRVGVLRPEVLEGMERVEEMKWVKVVWKAWEVPGRRRRGAKKAERAWSR